MPELLGGSADLTGSNNTHVQGMQPVQGERGGRYVHYGVREFGMAAIMNGIALHGGYIPYGGTFLAFSDYARNAMRMAALMRLRSIFVLTHDSIGLGEDGPTHQPIEHAASLRLMPNLDVWRPCDTVETAVAWSSAIARHDGPSALLLSRQNLPFVQRSPGAIAGIGRGGYVLAEAESAARATIIATGSEVALALLARERLASEGIFVRVVSMPSTSVFDRQDRSYREGVLRPELPCVAIEAGVTRVVAQVRRCPRRGGRHRPVRRVRARRRGLRSAGTHGRAPDGERPLRDALSAQAVCFGPAQSRRLASTYATMSSSVTSLA